MDFQRKASVSFILSTPNWYKSANLSKGYHGRNVQRIWIYHVQEIHDLRVLSWADGRSPGRCNRDLPKTSYSVLLRVSNDNTNIQTLKQTLHNARKVMASRSNTHCTCWRLHRRGGPTGIYPCGFGSLCLQPVLEHLGQHIVQLNIVLFSCNPAVLNVGVTM